MLNLKPLDTKEPEEDKPLNQDLNDNFMDYYQLKRNSFGALADKNKRRLKRPQSSLPEHKVPFRPAGVAR